MVSAFRSISVGSNNIFLDRNKPLQQQARAVPRQNPSQARGFMHFHAGGMDIYICDIG